MTSEFVGLTATERRIVEEYLGGHEPKEISQKLGVSIRTVYKALYKYRKNLRDMGLEEKAELLKVRKRRKSISASANINERFSSKHTGKPIEDALVKALASIVYGHILSTTNQQASPLTEAITEELCSLLRELNKSVNELRVALNRLSEEVALLRERLSEVPHQISYSVEETKHPIPSYLLDNPWVEVLKMRGKD